MIIPLKDSDFELDASGISGFFGGEEAISAMATVHVYRGRKWLGWYNSPGSYVVGKKYGQLANSRFWDGLFPGVSVDPAVLFELDGQKGPEYKGIRSGSYIKDTGNSGKLFMKECELLVPTAVKGRKTTPVSVAIAHLRTAPEERINPILPGRYSSLFASIPILASLAACAACGLFEDWYSFSMILLGIITSGISCYVIGCGELTFIHPTPARNSPKGDGILKSDKQMVILIGEEGAVNSVTRGRFSLVYKGEPEYRKIGICAMLLTAQFLLQLLLIPQGQLFGQLMFLSTVAVSWAYNSFLSSLDKEEIQRKILLEKVLNHPEVRNYELGTRTSMVVFTLLVLKHYSPQWNPAKLLEELLPNETDTWKIWRRAVLEKLERKEGLSFQDASDFEGVDEDQRALLTTLYHDAEDAFQGYLSVVARGAEGSEKKNDHENASYSLNWLESSRRSASNLV